MNNWSRTGINKFLYRNAEIGKILSPVILQVETECSEGRIKYRK